VLDPDVPTGFGVDDVTWHHVDDLADSESTVEAESERDLLFGAAGLLEQLLRFVATEPDAPPV
jgi:hypothetical protein